MIEKSMRAMASALVLTGTIASTVHAQTTTLYPRWSHQSGSENWVAREVSLGNEGTEVFSQLDVSGLSRRLFTEGCSAVAAPVWQSTDGQSTFYQRVASCESRSLHASARDEVTTAGHVIQLRVFTSGSSTAQWTFETPAATNAYTNFDVLITPAGDKIVLVGYRSSTARTEVRVFSPNSPTPVSSWVADTYGPSLGTRLSTDGSTLYVASSLAANVIRLDTGTVEHRTLLTTQVGTGHALSGDGRTFAFGLVNGACVYRRATNGTWNLAFARGIPQGSMCDQIAISEDGSRLALSYTPPGSNTGPAVVELLNLSASLSTNAPAVLWTRVVDATGTFQNRATQLTFSKDGRTLVAGFWGDDGGPSPEALVFRDDDAVPVHRIDLPGSIQKFSVTPDGRHVVVASKARHNTVFSGDGSIDYFDLGTPDLTVQDVPHAGGTVTLRARTDAGRPVRLLSASSRSNQPTPLGTVGMLHLSRTQLVSLSPTAVADAQGVAQFTWPLSSTTVGTSIYFQSLQLQPRELGQDWCKVTVLP